MFFLLQCPRLPLNIHHWTLHGKLWPLAYTQTPSHRTSGATIKQTDCCLQSEALSLHIKTHSPPLVVPFIFFLIHFQSPPPRPSGHPSHFLSNFTSSSGLPNSASVHVSLSVSLCSVMKREDLGSYSSWGGWASKGKGGWGRLWVLRGVKWKPKVLFWGSGSKMNLLYCSRVITLPSFFWYTVSTHLCIVICLTHCTV